MRLLLMLAGLALAALACSENPLDPNRLGKLETRIGDIDTNTGNVDTGTTPEQDCDGICSYAGECTAGLLGYGECYDVCMNRSRQEQQAAGVAAREGGGAACDVINSYW